MAESLSIIAGHKGSKANRRTTFPANTQTHDGNRSLYLRHCMPLPPHKAYACRNTPFMLFGILMYWDLGGGWLVALGRVCMDYRSLQFSIPSSSGRFFDRRYKINEHKYSAGHTPPEKASPVIARPRQTYITQSIHRSPIRPDARHGVFVSHLRVKASITFP